MISRGVVSVVLTAGLLLTAACGNDTTQDSTPPPEDMSEQLGSSESADTATDERAVSDATPMTDPTASEDLPSGEASPETEAIQQDDPTPSSDAVSERSMPAWSTGAVQENSSASAVAAVVDLRAGQHDRFNRFVVEFQGDQIPGYTVRYLDQPPIECGSGRNVHLPGIAVLELHLEPARGHTEQGTSTVDHSERSYAYEALHGAGVSCDFEAIFTVVLGVSVRHPFRVFELTHPARLIVDLLHTYP